MDARLETLLAEGKAFEFIEAVFVCGTAGRKMSMWQWWRRREGDLLDGGVLEKWLLQSMVVDCRFCFAVVFEFPGILSLVVHQPGIVVSLV